MTTTTSCGVLDELEATLVPDLLWLCMQYAGAPWCMLQGPRCKSSYWPNTAFYGGLGYRTEYIPRLIGVCTCYPFSCTGKLCHNS